MSVLIKGLKMPKNCNECPLHFYEGQGICCCRALPAIDDGEILKPWKNKRKDCPLVPVPLHGRLGDLDALVHDLDDDIENDQRVLDEMDFVGKERERVQFDKDCKQNCLWYLSSAPTVIPADESDMDSFIRIFEEDDEEDGMDSFIRILKD